MATSFKEIAVTVLNCGAVGLIAFMWINFAVYPWPRIDPNPMWDVLFLRTGGPILYANHVASGLAIVSVTSYQMARHRKEAYKWVFLVFSAVSIHEMALSVTSYPIYFQQYFHIINNPLTFRWFFWLSLVLVGAIYLANKEQRIRMFKIAIVCIVFDLLWVAAIFALNFDPVTIIQYSPGPAFLDPLPNFLEVCSWVLVAAMWL